MGKLCQLIAWQVWNNSKNTAFIRTSQIASIDHTGIGGQGMLGILLSFVSLLFGHSYAYATWSDHHAMHHHNYTRSHNRSCNRNRGRKKSDRTIRCLLPGGGRFVEHRLAETSVPIIANR